MFSLNKWLERKSDLLGAWASLFGIIAFPTVIVATIIGYFQLIEYYEKPDLHIEFSNPEALTFTLANRKDVSRNNRCIGLALLI